MREMTPMKTCTGIAFAALLVAAPAQAQLPQASASGLGMGYNLTAGATGFNAVANNPAGLSLPDNPAFSLSLLPVSVTTGLDPVTLGDLADWEGRLVPREVKEDWMGRVTAAGGQSGNVGLGISGLALSVGPLAFQLSTTVSGEMALGPDAAELIFFGNAGRTGEPRDFDLEGSVMDGYALSTAALSWGVRVTDRLGLGVTGKFHMGHALLLGRDAGSVLTADPMAVELSFPAITVSDSVGLNNGTGLGLDLGAVWQGDGYTLGASIQNVVNSFEWDFTDFSYIPGEALFNGDGNSSDFDERPVSQAPAEFLALAEGRTLKPVLALGVALDPTPDLRIQADLRKASDDGLALGPDFHLGVGAELRTVSVLPLRAHLARITDGFQFGGGASLILGPVHLSGAVAMQTGDLRDATLGMVSLSFLAN